MSKKINNNILRVVGSLGSATRMEIFHAFDGEMVWETLKRRLGFLKSSGKLEITQGQTPDRQHLWKLTNNGKIVVESLFPEDQPTEIVEE